MEQPSGADWRSATHPAAVAAFAAELALVVLAAVTGWRLGERPWTALLLAVVLPLTVVLVWGRWFAPRSAHRIRRRGARLAGQVVLFVVVAVLAAFVGLLWWGVALALVGGVAFAAAPRAL
ncbi:DUF2568 domain-containing protein [Cellulomonas algicola]|uniref:DUF2568 domain-containing protein n=1 Tax=Cellulomonas algicola TaxID=2071633 RepID=UPI001C3F9066|nr:DUF2568 domain-containing protein [Cellulomonas algicola]